ncbi:MAG TPA: hypothetical protein VFU07_05445 [Candidatus Lumbricidophila sp.]|nr:hypothetical protein [Candidatus Lumbricidophila sp.]
MPFELVISDQEPRHKTGPAKITVTESTNGSTRISMSAAVRNWLQPTKTTDRWGREQFMLRVALMVDRETKQLMLLRCDDTEPLGNGVYEATGVKSSNPSITEYGLVNSLGLLPGHYLAVRQGTALDSANPTGRAVLIDMSTQLEIKSRTQKPDARQQQRDQINTINEILNEGITLVDK